jgi:ectoine hydroxylase-related dioxygenase (phytanoyl-CoA dioxygenase family)
MLVVVFPPMSGLGVNGTATATATPRYLDTFSTEQLAGFWRDGYIVIPDFLSTDEVRGVLEELENLTGRLEGDIPPGASVAWEKDASDGKRIAHQVMNVHLLSDSVRNVVHSDRLKQMGQALLCDDLALSHSKFILKEKRKGTEIPWHQDMPYWLGEYSASFLTCLIYLSDADSSNGCLEVVPGSHQRGLAHYERSEGTTFELRTANIPTANVTHVAGRAGTAIVFGPFLVHRSGPNLSDRHRRSISVVIGSSWNLHIGRLDGAKTPLVESVLERRKIPRLSGPGSHNGAWAEYYRRRALRRLAKDCVVEPTRPWLELTDAYCEEDGFAWFTARKPRGCRLVRVQRYPLVTSPRGDAEVHTGDIVEQLSALAKATPGATAGLISFDFSTDKALRDALSAARPWMDAGTVLIIDRFFAPARRRGSRGRTLSQFAATSGVRLQYLARADFAVVARVEAIGTQGAVEYGSLDWDAKGVGIVFERETYSQFALDGLKKSRVAAGARRLLGPAWRGVRASVAEIKGVVRRA